MGNLLSEDIYSFTRQRVRPQTLIIMRMPYWIARTSDIIPVKTVMILRIVIMEIVDRESVNLKKKQYNLHIKGIDFVVKQKR